MRRSPFRSSSSRTGRKYSIQAVGDAPDELLEFVRSVGGKTLLLPHCADGDDFEKSVFEKSPIRTVWFRAASVPPESAEGASVAFGANSLLATAISDRLLGFIPKQIACATNPGDLSSDELLTQVRAEFGPG